MDRDTKVYNAEDVQRLLGISRSKVYEYLEKVYKDKKTISCDQDRKSL